MKSENKCDISIPMQHRTIIIDADGFRVSGTLHLPETSDPPVVIGSHGLLSSANSPKQISLANECANAGMAYFRFDHRGCGGSQGNLEKDTSLESRCSDMMHAVGFLKSQGLSFNRIGLFGSSMGGAVCISLANMLSINAMIINAAPVNLSRIGSLPEISEPLANNLRFDLSHNLKHLHHVLVFHGDADDVVPVGHAHLIYEHAQQPKRLVIFQNGDHAMSIPNHQQTFIRESVRWFREYLIDTQRKR